MKNEWVNPQTIIRLKHEKFGLLEVVREQSRAEPSTHRLKIVNPKNGDNPYAHVTYWPHPAADGLIYAYKASTQDECRQHGMAGSLLTLLSALEQKKIFLIPVKLAKSKKVYEKIGFKKDAIPWGNEKIRCLSLDNTSQLTPQEWAKQAASQWNTEHPDKAPRRAFRKFAIETERPKK